jgi:hypothetical protein
MEVILKLAFWNESLREIGNGNGFRVVDFASTKF